MRRPTPATDRWRYWETYIAGGKVTRSPNDDPPCGFFKVRKFRWAAWPSQRNPWVPARIYAPPAQVDEAGELLEPEQLIAEVDGKEFNPWQNDQWMYWTPITETEHQFLRAMSPLLPKTPPKK